MDCSLLGSSVHGILQARILEWVAISFSKGPSQLKDQNPCLLCWQAVCLPQSHQERPIYIYIYIYIFFFSFHILVSYRALQDIEYTTLYYTVAPCWLSVLYIVVCIC